MEYSKIVAVSGLPGLYELINSKGDGAVVRSLDDKSTKFASSRVHNFSHLESIEVFTVRENVNLVDVFLAMEKGSGSLPDTKDNNVVKKYFEKVFPDLDFERVYNSDLKKMIKWFESLKKNKIEIKLSEPEEETIEEEKVVENKKEKVEAKVKDKKEEKTSTKKTKKKEKPAAEKGSKTKKTTEAKKKK